MHDDMNHCIKQCWGICMVHSAHVELISWPIRSHVAIFLLAQGRWAGASSHVAALLLHSPQPCTKLCLMALCREVQEKWEWRKKGKESLPPLVRLNCTEAPLNSLHRAFMVVLALSARGWLLHFSTTAIWIYPLISDICVLTLAASISPSCHYPGCVFTDLQIHTSTSPSQIPRYAAHFMWWHSTLWKTKPSEVLQHWHHLYHFLGH